MSDAAQGDNQGDTPNFDDIASKIEEKVAEKLMKQDESFSQKLDELKSSFKEKEKNVQDNTDDSNENDADDSFPTMSEIRKMFSDHEKKIRKIAGEVALEVNSELTNKERLDQKTFNDFPMLNSDSPMYDKEFEKYVRQEIVNRKRMGRNANDPFLLYDAAAAVKAKNKKWNHITQENILEQRRKMNNQEGNFSVSGQTNSGKKVPNKSQLNLARNLGMTKEQLEKYMNRQS